MIAGSAVGAAALLTPFDMQVPLWGGWSAGALTALAAAMTAAVIALRAHAHVITDDSDTPRADALDRAAAAVAYALIAGLAVALVFIACDWLAADRAANLLQATVLASASLTFVAFAVSASARHTGTIHAVALLMTLIAVGSLTSIATTPDPDWWVLYFSQLGAFRVFSGFVFNGTLIMTGALILVFSVRVHREMTKMHRRSVLRSRRAPRTLAFLVGAVGFHLAMVGFIPVNTLQFWHDRAATGMTLAFAGMLATTPWLLRGMPGRIFRSTAWVSGILLVGAVLFIFGIINLTAFEVLAFALMFTWIGVFATDMDREQRRRADSGDTAAVAGDVPAAAPATGPRRSLSARRRRVGVGAYAARRAPAAGPRSTRPSRSPGPSRSPSPRRHPRPTSARADADPSLG